MEEPAPALVPVAMYDDLDDAEQAAKALVARGIGAIVQRVGHDIARTDEVPPTVDAQVVVLAEDRARASEILGFAAPADAAGGPPPKAKVPVKTVLLIFAVAMVVFPGLAFLLAYNLGQ